MSTQAERASSDARRPRAFTLMECVIAMTIGTILIGGTVGLMRTYARAAHEATDRNVTGAESAAALRELASDLREAKVVHARSDKLIEFSAPDRDGDGNDEKIRYEWSGKVNDPVVKSVNGAAWNVIDSVSKFVVSANNRVIKSSNDYYLIDVPRGSSGNRPTLTVGDKSIVAQFVKIPEDQTLISFTPTKVHFFAMQSGFDVGRTLVVVYDYDGAQAPWRVVGSAFINELSLDLLTPKEEILTLSNTQPVRPGSMLVVVFKSVPTSLTTINTALGLGVLSGNSSTVNSMKLEYAAYDTPWADSRLMCSPEGSTFFPSSSGDRVIVAIRGSRTYREARLDERDDDK